MYWPRWHYHVKDIAGAPYKIKKKRKANKTTESPTEHCFPCQAGLTEAEKTRNGQSLPNLGVK